MLPSLAKLALQQDDTGPPARNTRARTRRAREEAAPYAPSLVELPDDMLAHILNHLTSEDDVRAICGRVRTFCIANRKLCNETVWQEACAALGLTRANLAAAFTKGNTTWAVAFATLCNQMRHLDAKHRSLWLELVRTDTDAKKWPTRAANRLMRATTTDTPTLKRMLVAAGAPDLTEEEWKRMDDEFMSAVEENRPIEVERLLAAGAAVNHADDNGWTALYLASWHGHPAIVALLLARGVDVNQAVYDGDTALMSASDGGHAAVVEMLLAAGAAVNEARNGSRTALMAASWKGHAAIVEMLLAAGADVNHARNDGETALTWAEQRNHPEVAALLRAHGAR
jgi:hypothetical protein